MLGGRFAQNLRQKILTNLHVSRLSLFSLKNEDSIELTFDVLPFGLLMLESGRCGNTGYSTYFLG